MIPRLATTNAIQATHNVNNGPIHSYIPPSSLSYSTSANNIPNQSTPQVSLQSTMTLASTSMTPALNTLYCTSPNIKYFINIPSTHVPVSSMKNQRIQITIPNYTNLAATNNAQQSGSPQQQSQSGAPLLAAPAVNQGIDITPGTTELYGQSTGNLTGAASPVSTCSSQHSTDLSAA
ncbi:Hypothetical predicted protein, partial [Olea europaea subsp. europaea]